MNNVGTEALYCGRAPFARSNSAKRAVSDKVSAVAARRTGVGQARLNETSLQDRRSGMDHSRSRASGATLGQRARGGALGFALFALSGCAYSASAHWSLGGGSNAATTAFSQSRGQRAELLLAAKSERKDAPVQLQRGQRQTSSLARQRERSARVASPPAPAPDSDGDAGACYAALEGAGVSFTHVAGGKATGIDWPIQLTDALAGVRIQGASTNAPTNYLDCRLARALVAWAPQLRAAGVVGLEHYSMYRKGAVVAGAGTVSGHAHGFAIDVAAFTLQDGRRLRVLEDWTERTRGADPCATYTDTAEGALMRKLVCDAAARSLFQMVLTPHYNDAHGNHVHLEVVEDGMSFVR